LDEARQLVWRGLAPDLRDALGGRLAGLYGGADDASVFDALSVDKQRALLVFARRLGELSLWREIACVTNVYGRGGVGISFNATRGLKKRLGQSPRFTPRFAAHRDAAEGFYELRRTRAALHFLRRRRGGREWEAHFDLHAPLSSPLSALLHLWHERVRGRTPGWEEIAAALGYDLLQAGS
jgi:hypothetical protein